ncbi:cell division protein FtsZ [Selenomonas sp. AE3005]|uniref:cell division protein FtsZ n=1 Tax=Selenomonas sp. AE3005 TaxID=1485543 RepID=UPI0025EC4EA8|nr:cell division protein FtsZ [Selenomonas sp. AE3005]
MTAEESLIVKPKIKIKVFGVGGGGNSVLMRMGQHNELDIELFAINTDAKQLERVKAEGVNCIQIGENLTKGRGTGGRVELGEQAAKNDAVKIQAAMNGADMVFITAGMGGGTGTGAAPIVARLAKEMGILSMGVVTVPFAFEGSRKQRLAQEGITKMQSQMDALIAVENDNLSKLPENRSMSLVKAFECADNILKQAINCVAELILTTGVINVDFADVTTIFRQSESSDALLGIGLSSRSAVEAVKVAASSPLTDKNLKGARGVILNLTGDSTLSLFDVDEATRYIVKNTDPEVNVILGTVEDEKMDGTIQATLIATDFTDSVVMKAPTVKVPESTIKQETLKEETFQLDTPSFMNKSQKQSTGQPFAIPAFKLTPDDNGHK